MGRSWQKWIERVIDVAAAALLATAVGFSAWRLLPVTLTQPKLGIFAACAAVGAFALAARLLRGIAAERPRFALADFEIATLPDEPGELLLTELAELVLTDADRLRPAQAAADELVLDDILAELGPDSRVVRLFDRAAMPTPGQLSARIEGHLRGGSSPTPAAPDASAALYEALTELRRSLR